MDASELAFAGMARQAELIRDGEVSPRELVELCLERIERLDPQLNSFRAVFAERALAEADQAAARRGAGGDRPLLGVPIAIKDELEVAGEVMAFGTDAYGAPAARDSELVRRLRAAGAIPIGITNVPELTIWGFTESAAWGRTRNPWDVERSPGGSSGGSAAAVAAGLVGGAVATDGLGSIRIPAACCGLFGLKPQRGRISYAPLAEHWHGLSVTGCLGRRVADTAVFLDAVAGPAPGDADSPPAPERPFVDAATAPPGRLRIAISTRTPRLFSARVNPQARGALEETAEVLRSLGHDVRRADPEYGAIGPDILVRWLRGIHDDAGALARPHRLERRTRAMARAGSIYPDSVLRRARAAEARHRRRITRVFDEHDVLVTPTMTTLPFEVGRFEGRGALATYVPNSAMDAFLPTWNAIGLPAAAVPAGMSREGLPLSVQLVGRQNDEATLLSLAAQLEADRPWADRRPPVS
jgi:amidase